MIPIVDVDRAVMGFSLAVHIILASIGMVLPIMLIIFEYLGVKYNDEDYKALARRMSIIFLVLFAVGSSSGILVALELNLLWPKFMALVGQVAILPVYIEVFAFFMETIFIGIYVYTWGKFKWKYAHLLTAVPITIGAGASAVLIIMLNAFMNTPVGFNIPIYLSSGVVSAIAPLAVFSSPAVFTEVAQGASASYFAGAMIFAGYLAYRLAVEKDSERLGYYRKGLAVALAIGAVFMVLAIFSGILSIQTLATIQPEKYAAIEGNMYPQANAPEIIGGIPNANSTGLVDYIAVPSMQSVLLYGNLTGIVPGLSNYPQSSWPPLIVHLLFDFMFFAGIAVGIFIVLFCLRELVLKDSFKDKAMLYLLGLCSIVSVFIMEDGWVMAELARQPWIIYNVMTVSEAANTSPGILPVAVVIVAFYIAVIPVSLFVIRKTLRNPAFG